MLTTSVLPSPKHACVCSDSLHADGSSAGNSAWHAPFPPQQKNVVWMFLAPHRSLLSIVGCTFFCCMLPQHQEAQMLCAGGTPLVPAGREEESSACLLDDQAAGGH